jgi:tetratricopeptide (TPR) repeat protein
MNRLEKLASQENTALLAFLTRRGQMYLRLGKHEFALKDFGNLIALDKENGDAFTKRGITHLLMGKLEDALKDFDHAIQLGEKDVWIFAFRGETCHRMSMY